MRHTLAAFVKQCLTLALLGGGGEGGRPRLGRERGDANTRVSFVLRPDATDEREVQHLLLRAIRRESARQT